MGEIKETGHLCPIDEVPLTIDKCQPCRFFRGASLMTGYRDWKIICNWPRDGSYVEQVEIPAVFTEGWGTDGENMDDF